MQLAKHLKQSTIADGPDPNQVNPSDWNAAHVFSGDALGGLLMRDTGDATYGASWLSSVAAGQVLISNGVAAAPSWATSLTLSGNLTANGGGPHTLGGGLNINGAIRYTGVLQAYDTAYRSAVFDALDFTWQTSGIARMSINAPGNLSLAGLLSIAAFGDLSFQGSGNGGQRVLVRNSSTGANAYASMYLGNDVSPTEAGFVLYASTYSGSADSFNAPDSGSVASAGSGGLTLLASSANASIRLYTSIGYAERMRISSVGEVMINTSVNSGHGRLHLAEDGAIRNGITVINTNPSNSIFYMGFFNSAGTTAGSISQNGATGVLFNTTSDARLKDDDGPAVDLAALRAVVVHDFRWKADGRPDRGVFGQETYGVFPRAVTMGDDGAEPGDDAAPWRPWMVSYQTFVADLIVGWQQHDAELVALRAELAALKG